MIASMTSEYRDEQQHRSDPSKLVLRINKYYLGKQKYCFFQRKTMNIFVWNMRRNNEKKLKKKKRKSYRSS